MKEERVSMIVKDDIINYIFGPMNSGDMFTSIIIGTVTKDVILKTSKNNTIWTEIKILVETEHPRRAQLKLFGETAREASELYHKGDILFVIGEPKANSFVPKNGKDIINRIDIFPVLIKKLGNKEVAGEQPVVLK